MAGKPKSAKMKQKLSQTLLGKKRPKSHCDAMREGWKRRKAKLALKNIKNELEILKSRSLGEAVARRLLELNYRNEPVPEKIWIIEPPDGVELADSALIMHIVKQLQKVVEFAAPLKPSEINDPWTAYRIGESYFQVQQPERALDWYKRATEIWKYALDFQSKYGTCLLALGRTEEAMKIFEFVLSENPNHIAANVNVGFIYLQQGNNTMAYEYMKKAQQLDPDHEQNLINLGVWYHTNYRDNQAKKVLQHLVKKHPENEQGKAMLNEL